MPLCVVDRTTSFNCVEADLCCALLITVGGNRPSVSRHQVPKEISRTFNVVINSMVIMLIAPEDFLLVPPDATIADKVFN
jgi:hypothetical protein